MLLNLKKHSDKVRVLYSLIYQQLCDGCCILCPGCCIYFVPPRFPVFPAVGLPLWCVATVQYSICYPVSSKGRIHSGYQLLSDLSGKLHFQPDYFTSIYIQYTKYQAFAKAIYDRTWCCTQDVIIGGACSFRDRHWILTVHPAYH